MDRLHTLEVFAAVADNGSFAKAARAMRLSPPAVTRAIAALEDRLGTRLFVRTTRSVRLTEAGVRPRQTRNAFCKIWRRRKRQRLGPMPRQRARCT